VLPLAMVVEARAPQAMKAAHAAKPIVNCLTTALMLMVFIFFARSR